LTRRGARLFSHQADLDLGNYERFVDITLTRDHNITTGKIYQARGGRACARSCRFAVAAAFASKRDALLCRPP